MRALLYLFTELSCAYFTYSVAQRYIERTCPARSRAGRGRARRRTRPLRPVHRISGKHSIALSERGLRRAVHAKCQSRRIYNRSVAPTIHVKLAAAPQHPTALVASRTIIASPIGVRAARALLLIALDRLNAEGDAPVREVHACVGTVSEIGFACV